MLGHQSVNAALRLPFLILGALFVELRPLL